MADNPLSQGSARIILPHQQQGGNPDTQADHSEHQDGQEPLDGAKGSAADAGETHAG